MDEYDDMTTADVVGLPKGWSAWMYSVAWHNPYTQPPDGEPRHLFEAIVTAPKGRGCPPPPPDVLAILREKGLGSGWMQSICCLPAPIKHWSAERTFAYRKSRLALRMNNKFPMFAEAFIAEAMARKPEYYGLVKGATP